MSPNVPENHRLLKLTRPVTITNVDGAVIITSPSTGQVFSANPSARLIVEALVGGATRADLVKLLAQRFRSTTRQRLDEGQLSLDVDQCLFLLANEGWIDHAAL